MKLFQVLNTNYVAEKLVLEITAIYISVLGNHINIVKNRYIIMKENTDWTFTRKRADLMLLFYIIHY